jgi:hypothetical protein
MITPMISTPCLPRYQPVRGEPGIVKDNITKAVLTNDARALAAYRARRDHDRATDARLNTLEARVAELEAAVRHG